MIHELDREYHELLDKMPDAFQHEYASLEAQDPYIRAKRYIAIQGIHVRYRCPEGRIGARQLIVRVPRIA